MQDTLAKDISTAAYHGSALNGQRRIMTPTSRLAETAVGVREVSKKIGKYTGNGECLCGVCVVEVHVWPWL